MRVGMGMGVGVGVGMRMLGVLLVVVRLRWLWGSCVISMLWNEGMDKRIQTDLGLGLGGVQGVWIYIDTGTFPHVFPSGRGQLFTDRCYFVRTK
ncbi:hypothetical protein B0J18DRAFT_436442 [Chaetomium sp. MPI-SDFR-AT-0129]|nr:hypothetical protein B0J18DRAFT_436442 [Chaetomium sp. MPI-SDFR-AT-0129]